MTLPTSIKTSPKPPTSPNPGLSHAAVLEARRRYGPNSFTTVKYQSNLVEFLNNFTDPLVIVLVIIALISFFSGQTLNGSIIAIMVFLSTLLNFLEEHRAHQSAQKLLAKVAHTVTVRRDGQIQTLPSLQLVPGDLMLLNAGDLISADARLISANHLFINQSALTGESFPVAKTTATASTSPSPSTNNPTKLFAGTSVVSGEGEAVVTGTGLQTQYSHIMTAITQSATPNSFQAGIHQFSRFLVWLILTLVALIFGLSLFAQHSFFTSFSFAIAVAVGLTPEFLPMVMSVTMTKGALLMAKKGIIVKKLSAIPAFGSMDLLCTDKTGTLTEDRIRLVTCTDLHGRHSPLVLKYAFLNSYFQSGITNPMDAAIIDVQPTANPHQYQKLDELPFDFDRRLLSVLIKSPKKTLIITKGSPENLIAHANSIYLDHQAQPLTPAYVKRLRHEYQRLSQIGYRVLALSFKSLNSPLTHLHPQDEQQLTFLGFISFLDPVKPKIKSALDALGAVGIQVKVISGDNDLVCRKICTDAGIDIKGVITGDEIDALSDTALTKKLNQVSICARFSPIQKERAIGLLRQSGHVVGYLGDGINDAPSLKAADVGISVHNAVDIAKETADFIMTNKSLINLKDGVISGRQIFQNTQKYLLMGLSSNFGNMLSMLGAVLFLPFLPMLPLQLLLNNFLYDFAQISLPTDHVDPETVTSPQRWNLSFIKQFMFIFGPISTLFDFVAFYFLYHLFQAQPQFFQTGWFMVSLATQTLVIHVIRTRRLPFIHSRPSPTLLLTTCLVPLLGWVIPYLSFGRLFSFVPLPPTFLLPLFSIVAVYLILTQIVKTWFYTQKYPL